MNTIICPSCGKDVEISTAIRHQIEENVLAEAQNKYKEDLVKLQKEIEEKAKKKATEALEFKLKDSANELQESKERNTKLQEQLLELTKTLRSIKEESEKQKLENEKHLMRELEKSREVIVKAEQERSGLEKKELEKKLEDMTKALEEAKRKAQQSSQQLQGEVLELELEALLTTSFPSDEIKPISKGVSGADIRHIVKSPKGFTCGVILWEFKRTKEWSDKWVPKLKEDVRVEKANIPVIVSMQLPKEAENGFGIKDGVWICSHALVIPLAMILRKNLLDIGYQKAISANRGDKAELLYTYITSHEFQQQIESIVEAYGEIQNQIIKERIIFEKIWKQRETQAQRVVMSTANIIGAMQGKVGASMPPIKGLELPQLDIITSQIEILEDDTKTYV